MKLNNEVKILSIVTAVVAILSIGIYFFAGSQKSSKVEYLPVLQAGNGNFSVGPASAKVTVTEFFDPECETCAQVGPYIKNEVKYYGSRVHWIFRYMAYHPSSSTAIHILEASRNQNLYFETLALLFQSQKEWGAKHDGSEQTPKEQELIKIVSNLPGLNLKQLQEDMKNPAIDALIENDKKEGATSGVTGTPTLFVNGKIIDPLSLDVMIQRIDAELK
jgi:protein-disulfide isomerase